MVIISFANEVNHSEMLHLRTSVINIPLNDCFMLDHTTDQLERQHIDSVQVTVVSTKIEAVAALRQTQTCYNLHLAGKIISKHSTSILVENHIIRLLLPCALHWLVACI